MLGFLILYLKGMRRMMFQLSGFHYGIMALPQVPRDLHDRAPETRSLTSRVQVLNNHILSKLLSYIASILKPSNVGTRLRNPGPITPK